MNEVKIDVPQTPRFVLRFRLSKSMVFLMVVVPEFGDDENLFTLDEAFFDGALDALACFVLILVVVCAVEKTVADFDGLRAFSLPDRSSVMDIENARCRLCQQPARPGLSKGRSQREAFHGQKPA